MARWVWKFTVPLVTGIVEVAMPSKANLLHVAIQHEEARVWASVDPASEAVKQKFVWIGTGSAVPPTGAYVGTVFTGAFVFHLYHLPEV